MQSPFRYLGGFNPAALIALASGFIIYVYFFNPQTLDNTPLFAFMSASLPSCALAGIVHIVLTRIFVSKTGWGDYPAKEADGSATSVANPAYD
jgi:NCS1 family nucleobase:cation symporter-1